MLENIVSKMQGEPSLQKKRIVAKMLVRHYFKDDYGKPFELSDGQADIFNSIFLKEYNRVQIIASTQYGKSTTIALALILRTQIFAESFVVLAGSQSKAKIIMEKVIQHCFDNQKFYTRLELDANEPLERLKRERSKDRITWKGGGEIRIFSAQTKSRKNLTESLMGLGSPNIVEDESALIPDDFQAMVLRMLGGHKENFLCKVGNSFTRGHFLKTWNSDKYAKVMIDYKQALKEGRYTQEFIDEMSGEPFFNILYGCEFPDAEAQDTLGYFRLLSDAEIITAKQEGKHKGTLRLGFDVGEGGDMSVGVLRSDKYAEVVHTSSVKDLMATTSAVVKLIDTYKIEPSNVYLDAIGIGAGVAWRLKELGKMITAVKWSEKASKDVYKNCKAEHFMKSREWLKGGGTLAPKDDWNELMDIRYKEDTMGKIAIKTKEEMRKEGIPSPNKADAFALTFARSIEDDMPNIRII